MACEMRARGLPPPCCLLVSGRAAPHRIQRPVRELLVESVAGGGCTDAEFIQLMKAGGILTPDHSFPTEEARRRFCAVAQSDIPIAQLEVGQRKAADAAEDEDEDASIVGTFAIGAPRLDVRCPLVAILSRGDTMWPAGSHIDRWRDVAAKADELTDGRGPSFRPHVLDSVPHHQLQSHAQTRQVVWSELADVVARMGAASAPPSAVSISD